MARPREKTLEQRMAEGTADSRDMGTNRQISVNLSDESRLVRPRGLEADVSEAWDRIVKAVPRQLVTGQDQTLVLVAARTIARVEKLESELAEETKLTIEYPNGMIGAHPLLGVIQSERAALLKLLAMLGMTPEARLDMAKSVKAALIDQHDAETMRKHKANKRQEAVEVEI